MLRRWPAYMQALALALVRMGLCVIGAEEPCFGLRPAPRKLIVHIHMQRSLDDWDARTAT